MNTMEYIRGKAASPVKYALPVLSFPAVQRLGVTVADLVASPSLMAQAMQIVSLETPSVAAVSQMDLSVEAEAFGASVRFSDNDVPTIRGQLVQSAEDAASLSVPAIGSGRTGVCIEGIRQAKKLISDRPVLAGVIGPYSLAGRLMDVTEIMYTCFDEPETVHVVLRKATAFLKEYILALRDAGADGVVMAEPLAGLLSRDMALDFSIPYVASLIRDVQSPSFAFVYHNCGAAITAMADDLFRMGAAAYHFGNAVSLPDILEKAPENAVVMGNIDPARLFVKGTPEEMRQAVLNLLSRVGQKKNFILSSGCDIPAGASWENIAAFFHALDEYNAIGK